MSWTNSCTSGFYERFLRRQNRNFELIEREDAVEEHQTQLEEFS